MEEVGETDLLVPQARHRSNKANQNMIGASEVASKYFHSAPHVNVPKYLYTALCMMFNLNVSQDSLTYIIGLTTVNRPDAARRFAQSTLSRRRRNRHSQTYQIRATWLPLTKDTIAG
jgi:hypothetical protein